jgi:hypothetical protein
MINAAGTNAGRIQEAIPILEVEMERVLNLPRRIAADHSTGVPKAVV